MSNLPQLPLRILCVEDDMMSQTLLRSAFFEEQLDFASSLEAARQRIRDERYDAFLLDLNLPDGSALDLLSEILSLSSKRHTPTLFISGTKDSSDIVRAFQLGAEDFIHKPFDPLVLKARVYAKIDKSKKMVTKILPLGCLRIDLLRSRVWADNPETTTENVEKNIILTAIEFKILLILAQANDHFCSREQLTLEIWGQNHRGDRTLDSHVAHLRSKISPFGLDIEALKGQGYKILIP